MFRYFNNLLKEIKMTRVIVQEIAVILDAAVKAGHLDAAALKALQDKDIEQDAKNLEQDAALADAKADLQAIADAIKNPALPPVETANAVASVLTDSAAVPGTVTPAFPG